MAQAPKKAAAPSKAPVKAAPAKSNGEDKEPGVIVVSARLSDATMKDKYDGRPSPVISVEYNFGTNLDEAAELFTPEVVFNKFVDSGVIDLQSKLRRHIEASLKTVDAKGNKITPTPLPKDPQELVADWKPAAGNKERKSAAEKVSTLVGKLTEQERKELIERLRSGA